jgi:hypothetical protein
LILVCSAYQVQGQQHARQYPGKVKYLKKDQEATIFDLPYPASQVEQGMKDLANKQGVKVREKNGFYEVKGYKSEKLAGVYDVYYQVDKAGKRESKLAVIFTEPGEDLSNRTSSHAALVGAASGASVVLASIAPHLDNHDFELLKQDQEEDIAKAEKKLSELQEEQSRFEKKIADLQKELEKNRTDQNNKAAEIEAKKSGLAKFLESRNGKKKG